jgi:hypothetical protein
MDAALRWTLLPQSVVGYQRESILSRQFGMNICDSFDPISNPHIVFEVAVA